MYTLMYKVGVVGLAWHSNPNPNPNPVNPTQLH